MKLSSASTSKPLASNASQRCEPMKPAPPETTARALLAADASIGEAQAAHDRRVVDVSPVDHYRFAHRGLHTGEVQEAELVPPGDQHQRIGSVGDRIRVRAVFDLGEQRLGTFHC